MTNKLIAAGIAAIVVAGVGSFYAGVAYGKSAAQAGIRQSQQFGARAGGIGVGRGARGGGDAVAGQVIALDDKTITLKLRDGGSRIVFLGESTSVGKTIAGVRADIMAGQEVTAIGTPNDDGSMTAQSVQIRPATRDGQNQ